MLTLAAVLILSQASQCVASNGQAACAQTPWGRCVATNGRIFCGDPAPAVLRVLEDPPPVACLTANGAGACGYDCKSTNGVINCARTPWGRCVTTNGQVFCGDPGPLAFRARVDLPPVECVTTNGTAACGYSCVTNNGRAECAQTPWGRCVATNGRIFCGDPGPWSFRRPGIAPPQVDCLTTNGTAACGYDCKKANGVVACASTAGGQCIVTNGTVTCSR